ncbi:hypothetical protein AVEN_23989-1 [Araneus ventricosus]|uniref:Uncharacterized protein n=1 Tax=Araneus ventricosus TaxID=182803 RepID=A0A4Y2D0V5_ARAVE|nr:hypothetical protein AVEN_23989-1 [Araneus ventricosus]
MEAPDCEVEAVSEHENHASEERATSHYDENIVTHSIHNVQHIQSKHQNISWSLDQPARSGSLNSANFMKTSLSVTSGNSQSESSNRQIRRNKESFLFSASEDLSYASQIIDDWTTIS